MHLPKLILESSGRSSISGSSSNTRSSSSSLVLLLYINSNMFSLYSIKDIGGKPSAVQKIIELALYVYLIMHCRA